MKQERLAQMWCELNCWETPKEIKKRQGELTEDQIGGAMAIIELMTTDAERKAAWLKGDGIRVSLKKRKRK